MTDYAAIAQTLGVSKLGDATPADFTDHVTRGLPVDVLDRISRLVSPQDGAFKYRIVPKASVGRRKDKNALSAAESERVARLARVWTRAVEVWGDDDAARRFLLRPHPLLNQRAPMDLVLTSETGADLVRDILGRLQWGTAA